MTNQGFKGARSALHLTNAVGRPESRRDRPSSPQPQEIGPHQNPNLALGRDIEHVRELFERLSGHANDVGPLAEQVYPSTGQQPGNFPQAFGRIGVIETALDLEKASAEKMNRASSLGPGPVAT